MDLDKTYRETPLNKIPWNYETPPDSLIELVKSGQIRSGRAIDLGCGTGNYAIYLATNGFNVTGIDNSPSAITIARNRAKEKQVECSFLVADLVSGLEDFKNNFDFAFDWELLHHIFPEERQKYIENVYCVLNSKGKYLSVSFSEDDPCFGGQGKYRETPLGTVLYFSSKEELRKLFRSHFNIIELKTIEIRGKPIPHIANYVFMECK